MNFRDKKAMVIDHGLFVELAVRLARDFGTVYYFMPWVFDFPRSSLAVVGDGLEGVTRVLDFWEVFNEVDIFVFPDIGDGGLQEYLRSIGKRVFGSGRGERLENDRWWMRKLQSKLGMNMPETDRVTGLENVREFLKDKKDRYVKVSQFRGDVETWKHENPAMTEIFLNELSHTLGAKQKTMEFVIEAMIPAIAEIGYDGLCVDGNFPIIGAWGLEIKDQCYLGKIEPYAQMPRQLIEVNNALAPTLKSFGVRGFMSTEVRLSPKGLPYLIDPAMRCGSPPSEVYMEAWENISEMIWEAAEGRLAVPKSSARYVASAEITSEWSVKNWNPIIFPPEYRKNIKLKYLTKIEGNYYVVPQLVTYPEIGFIIGMGKTPQEAIEQVKTIAKTVKGIELGVQVDTFDEALEELAGLAKLRIKF